MSFMCGGHSLLGADIAVYHSTESSPPPPSLHVSHETTDCVHSPSPAPHLRCVLSPPRSLRFMDKEIRVKFTGGREGAYRVVCGPVATT